MYYFRCPDNVIAGFSYMALADHTHTADAHVRGMDVRTPGVNLTAVNAAIDVAVSNGACAVATNATLAKMSDYCWWWTDALYMALPTVARAGALAHSQGDTKRATMIWDYARAQYDITAFGTNATGAPAFNLWSPADSLFWRDVSFITKHAPNARNGKTRPGLYIYKKNIKKTEDFFKYSKKSCVFPFLGPTEGLSSGTERTAGRSPH